MNEPLKIPVDLLRPGMRIVSLDRPWTEVPVLFQGFVIKRLEQVRTLRHYCMWVAVDADADVLAGARQAMAQRQKDSFQPLPEQQPLERELPRAKRAYQDTLAFVDQAMSTITQGGTPDIADARPLVRQCVASISSNANAMFWLSRIKSRDAYTAQHSLRVAIYAISFARFMGVCEDDLEVVGLCGLLHDIGKLKVPPEILNKPGMLDDEEMGVMRLHPEYGEALLRQSPTEIDPIILDVTRHHHERLSGEGYPDRLKGWQVSRFARLIAIVDVFDAVTSERAYRKGLSVSDAMRILYQARGEQFDPEMIEAFIRMVGIYPPGSLVELSSGEVAVVVATHPAHKLQPQVEIILDRQKKPCVPRLVDLASLPTAAGDTACRIRQPLPDGGFGVDLDKHIETVMAGGDSIDRATR